MDKVIKPKEDFGVLTGVRVINAASAIAGPFAASLMADWGADVVWVENPRVPDVTRTNLSPQDNRRNQRNLSLDIPSEKGKQVFLKLVETADILIESSKGGQYVKWGITDELLWEHNPALVIMHVSGFGQYGDPKTVKRGAYDAIGQAFGCYLNNNGYPDMPAVPAMIWTGDFIPALMGCGAALAAYIKAQKTGEGESIDLANYEALLRVQNSFPLDYLISGIPQGDSIRPGDRGAYAAWGNYECKDGRIFICMMGTNGTRGLLQMLDLPYGSEMYPEGLQLVKIDDPGAPELNKRLEAWLETKTMEEVDETLNGIGVACSPIMTYQLADQHPHYIAREDFTEWETPDPKFAEKIGSKTVRGVNVTPKFTKHPGKIVRGCVTNGYDNEEILTEIGYTEEEIQALYDSKTIATNDTMMVG